MKRILLSLVINLMVITGLAVADGTAQQTPPSINVSLAFSGSLLQDRLLYLMGDRIQVVLTLHNMGGQEITSKGFSALPFHLFLTFTDPDGKGIIANELLSETGDDAPPPPVIPVGDQLPQVEPVERLPGNWILSTTLPNAHAYYTLSKPGNYSVKATIRIRTYLGIDHTVDGVDYSEITRQKWENPLESNTVHFTLLADADGDGFYYPEGYPSDALADCNDNDPKEKPGQTWYKDADNDRYSDDLNHPITLCTRPLGYKVLSELLSTTLVDCDDNNPNMNPGKTEIPCNGIDDDCNPATPDFPAPTLASPPANGATGVSTTPTLRWSGISCATSYGVQVARNPGFSPVDIDQSVAGTSFTVSTSTPLSNNTTYYWHVSAKKSGETSAWSPSWSFTTTTKKAYLLTVKKAGTGFGIVTPSTGTLDWDGNTGKASYPAGTKVTLTATTNPGYTFTGWSAFCSGSGNCSVVISGSTCTVNMCGPCNATATFTIKTFTITATAAGPNGSISPKGNVKVNYGANQTFTITPNNGYKADVKVDGVSQGAITNYTFKNVTANHTISATFTTIKK
jgi:hypothetical protein